MRELQFCLRTMIYKRRWIHYFLIVWLFALLIPTFQFLGIKTSAMAGTVETSFFLISVDNFFQIVLISAIPLISALFVGDIHFEENSFKNQLHIRC